MHVALQQINKDMLFIPVTTRSPKEYMRIKYFYEEMKPKYAVVANGAMILKNGIELTDWSDIITEKVKEVLEVKAMIKLCSFFLESNVVKSYKTCEDLYICCIIDVANLSNIPSAEGSDLDVFKELTALCSKHNYTLSNQGKKVYIVPNCINKYDPLNYIMNLEDIDILIAAGDSLLDYPMIKHSTFGIIPAHGELLRIPPLDEFDDNVYITKASGILAGEEVLSMVLGKLQEINGI